MFSHIVEDPVRAEKKKVLAEEVQQFLRENRSELYANISSYKFLKLDCEAFSNNGMIPAKYTCDGVNINPPIDISYLPEKAKSLAIIVDDHDALSGTFCHWAIWNIPVTDHINEGEHRGLPGRNDFGFYKYNGPCPPVGTHHYYFKVYALDCNLSIPASCGKKELEKAMVNHVVGFGFLIGKYHMRL